MRPPHPGQPLLLLDYDGTLAPIVEDPAAAHPHPEAPELLARLDARYPLVLISGRHLGGLSGFLGGLALRAVGLHGAQEGRLGAATDDGLPAEAVAALAALRGGLPTVDGVRVEEKGPAFAVHYRGAPAEAAAEAALRRWAAGAPSALEPVWGKKVVELRPAGVSKGTVAFRLAAEHPGHTPVYLGDDTTDEDAFAALRPPAVTVKVGPGTTAARYRLRDVDAVVAYLRGFLPG